MGSVKNIVNHHCFVGFSLHSVFKLGTNTTARNEFFFCFFQNPFYCCFTICFVGFSLHLFFWVTPYNITCFSEFLDFIFFAPDMFIMLFFGFAFIYTHLQYTSVMQAALAQRLCWDSPNPCSVLVYCLRFPACLSFSQIAECSEGPNDYFFFQNPFYCCLGIFASQDAKW